MTLRSFSSALAAALNPPLVDVLGTLGYVPTPKQQIFHDVTEFSVLIGDSAPNLPGIR
jgi:hypothetical protein